MDKEYRYIPMQKQADAKGNATQTVYHTFNPKSLRYLAKQLRGSPFKRIALGASLPLGITYAASAIPATSPYVDNVVGYLAGVPKEDRYQGLAKDSLLWWTEPVKQKADATVDYVGKKVEDAVRKGAEVAEETLQGPPELRASSDPQKGSWLATINPISSLTGGTDYVPEKWNQLFTKGKTEGSKEYSDALRNAHLSFKSLAIGLLAAGVMGGYNVLRHMGEHSGITEGNYAGKGLSEDLSTTFTGDLTGVSARERKKRKRMLEQQKEASLTKQADPTDKPKYNDTYSDGNFKSYNVLNAILPVGALLLAGGLAWRGTNAAYDQQHNEELTASIEAKRNALKRIVAERARLAKGTQIQDPIKKTMRGIDEDEIYTKDASLNKEALLVVLVQGTGLLLSAILLASAVGSYHFTKASDPNNIAYAAYNRALKEYAKNRASVTPLAIEPDAAQDYFDYLNSTQEPVKKRTAREQPDIDTDALNKPISISI